MKAKKALSVLYAALAVVYGCLVAPVIVWCVGVMLIFCLIVAAVVILLDVIHGSYKCLTSGESSSLPPPKLHSEQWDSDESDE